METVQAMKPEIIRSIEMKNQDTNQTNLRNPEAQIKVITLEPQVSRTKATIVTIAIEAIKVKEARITKR